MRLKQKNEIEKLYLWILDRLKSIKCINKTKNCTTLKTVQHNIHGFSYIYTIQGESK